MWTRTGSSSVIQVEISLNWSLYIGMMLGRGRSAVVQKPHTISTPTKLHHLQRPQNSSDMRENKQLFFWENACTNHFSFSPKRVWLFSCQWYRMETNELQCWTAKTLQVMNMHNMPFDFFQISQRYCETHFSCLVQQQNH